MPRNNQRAEPSAPPIYMMSNDPGSNDHDRDRSPPPRYEEAIADEGTLVFKSSDSLHVSHPTQNETFSIQQNERLRSSSHHRRSSRRSSSCNPDNRNTSTSTSSSPPSALRRRAREDGSGRDTMTTSSGGGGGDGSSNGASRSAHHRSVSPGDLSDGSRDLGQSDETQLNSTSGSAGTNQQKDKKKGGGGGGGGSKSKIKKGLENIAFFIIQILD